MGRFLVSMMCASDRGTLAACAGHGDPAQAARDFEYWFEHELRQYPLTTFDVAALRAGLPPERTAVLFADRVGAPLHILLGGHVGYLTYPAEFAPTSSRCSTPQHRARWPETMAGPRLGRFPDAPRRARHRRSSLQGPPHALRRGRHVQVRDAARPQCVHHGVHRRWQRAGRAGLANAFHAQAVAGRRHQDRLDRHLPHQVGVRHGVVHEA